MLALRSLNLLSVIERSHCFEAGLLTGACGVRPVISHRGVVSIAVTLACPAAREGSLTEHLANPCDVAGITTIDILWLSPLCGKLAD